MEALGAENHAAINSDPESQKQAPAEHITAKLNRKTRRPIAYRLHPYQALALGTIFK